MQISFGCFEILLVPIKYFFGFLFTKETMIGQNQIVIAFWMIFIHFHIIFLGP